MAERFDLNQPVPILILGDGPDQPNGLGRIGHDLAWLLSSMPEFKVGYLGRLAFGRAKYPWAQYSFGLNEQWGEGRLEEAWHDLAGNTRGVVLTAWDASRLMWLADPVGVPNEAFLRGPSFSKWGYFMHDCAGVWPRQMPMEASHVMSRFDRTLLASRWAYQLAPGAVQVQPGDWDWLPHGINTGTFQPMDRRLARSAWAVDDSTVVVGCVMSNQQRKHWATVFEMVAMMPDVKLWVHTDRWVHYWNLNALAIEYGIQNQILTEDRKLSDYELAMRYSACDATVVISGGEGFCYPVAESLACGTPVVTGKYGAQAELTPWTIMPQSYAIETQHNVRRAQYQAAEFATMIGRIVGEPSKQAECVALVEHLDWKRLGVQWKKWFRKGLAE